MPGVLLGFEVAISCSDSMDESYGILHVGIALYISLHLFAVVEVV